MTDTNQNQELSLESTDGAQLDSQASPGELLRAAREQAKLSTAQVAERLRLRHSQIVELEANEFSKYIGGTYIRGYLRAYAKLVNLDEAEIISAYQNFIGEQSPAGQMQSFSRRIKLESEDNKLMLITWVIILLLVGSVAVFVWQQFSDEQNGQTLVSATTAEIVTERAESPMDLSDADLDAYEGVASDGQAYSLEETESWQETPTPPESMTEVIAEPTPVAINQVPTQSEAVMNTDHESSFEEDSQTRAAVPMPPPSLPAIPEAELVLRFSDDCWVRIEDATGAVIAFGVKRAGHVMPLNGEAPFEITLGAPQAVELYFRGESIDLSIYRRGIARFQLPAQE